MPGWKSTRSFLNSLLKAAEILDRLTSDGNPIKQYNLDLSFFIYLTAMNLTKQTGSKIDPVGRRES